jgi:hypothetical protein
MGFSHGYLIALEIEAAAGFSIWFAVRLFDVL